MSKSRKRKGNSWRMKSNDRRRPPKRLLQITKKLRTSKRRWKMKRILRKQSSKGNWMPLTKRSLTPKQKLVH